jgi:hypothetical protein
MAGTIYVGQPVTLVLDCTLDNAPIDNAVSVVLSYQRPDKTEGEWLAAFDNATSKMTCEIEEGALSLPGKWKVQPFVLLAGGKTIPGTTVEMPVTKLFS